MNDQIDESGYESERMDVPPGTRAPQGRALVQWEGGGLLSRSSDIPVARFAEHVGKTVSGFYHLTGFRTGTDRFGRPFCIVEITDGTGSARVYGWPRNGVPGAEIGTGGWVEAHILVRRFNGTVTGDLLELTRADCPIDKVEKAPGGGQGRFSQAELGERLERYLRTSPVEPLRVFLAHAFADPRFRKAFLTRPASRAHHHAWPGGLCEHSLEVAAIAESVLVHESSEMRCLARVAGLVHDVSKVRTLNGEGHATRLGWVLRHEALTLEILASALAHLESLWPDGATGLRYLLTWNRSEAGRRPLLPAALALEFADHYSSASSARDLAFHAAEDWQRFAVLETPGPKNRFWRPREWEKTLSDTLPTWGIR